MTKLGPGAQRQTASRSLSPSGHALPSARLPPSSQSRSPRAHTERTPASHTRPELQHPRHRQGALSHEARTWSPAKSRVGGEPFARMVAFLWDSRSQAGVAPRQAQLYGDPEGRNAGVGGSPYLLSSVEAAGQLTRC